MAIVARAEWLLDTKGSEAEVVNLPPLVDLLNCRSALRQTQLGFPLFASVVARKREELDPQLSKWRKHPVVPLRLVMAATCRQSLVDDILEKRIVIAAGVLRVTVIPNVPVGDGVSWRRWLYDQAHSTVLDHIGLKGRDTPNGILGPTGTGL